MTEDLIIQKLTPIFRSVFKNPELEVSPSLTSMDVQNWTSLTNTVMLFEVEKVFGIKFGFADILDINNVGDLIILIKSKVR